MSVDEFYVDDVELAAAEVKYELIVKNHPLSIGRQLSSNERSRCSLMDSTLIYGETDFAPLAIAFQKIQKEYGGLEEPGGIFVDVGAGVGKALIIAAVCHEWDECVGLEILPDLAAAGKMLCTRYREVIRKSDSASATKLSDTSMCRIDLAHIDATRVDWSTATCVFINATCFTSSLMERLSSIADRMAAGTWAITITRKLISAEWAILDEQTFSSTTEGGGMSTFYIHRKMAPPPPATYFKGIIDGRITLEAAVLGGKKVTQVPGTVGGKKPVASPLAQSPLALAIIAEKPDVPKHTSIFSVKKRSDGEIGGRAIDPLESLMGPSYVNGEKALDFKKHDAK